MNTIHKLEQFFYGFLMLPGFILGYVVHMAVQGFLTGEKVAMKQLEEGYREYVQDEHSMGICDASRH